MYVTSHYCFVSSSSLSSSVCVSSLSSSYLIYRRMRVMPNLCDYYHSLSINSRVLTKRKEINMPYLVRLGFFFLFLVVDYLTITTSITTNASSPHQLETQKKEKEKKETEIEQSLFQVFIVCVTIWQNCVYVCAYVWVHRAEQTETHPIP